MHHTTRGDFYNVQRRIPLRPTPKPGDSKSTLPFAYLPKTVGDSRVWLERYEVLWVWEERKLIGNVEGQAIEFTCGHWIRVKEKLINRKA